LPLNIKNIILNISRLNENTEIVIKFFKYLHT